VPPPTLAAADAAVIVLPHSPLQISSLSPYATTDSLIVFLLCYLSSKYAMRIFCAT
jgi:hypothetical protein